MHQKNSNHVGYHHIKAFWYCSMYKEDRYARTIYHACFVKTTAGKLFGLLKGSNHAMSAW